MRGEGLNEYADALDDALDYSGSSGELYFKSSAVLKKVLLEEKIKNELLVSKIKKTKSEVDRYTS